MDRIAKSPAQTQPVNVENKTVQGLVRGENPVHPEMYKYFNANPVNTDEKIKLVNAWAFSEAGSLGEALQKVRKLEIRLGAPALDETRVSKLYNWIRMTDHINKTTNLMDTEVRKIQESSQKNIESVKKQYETELEKLNNQITQKESQYRKALREFQLNANLQAEKVKNQYKKQLEELRTIRNAYDRRKK